MVVGPHDGIMRSGRKTRALSLCHVKTQQELVIFKLERRLSQGTESAGTLILNFEPPKLWDVNVCCVRDFPGGPVVKILLPMQVMGLIPDWGTKIPYATWYIQGKKGKKCFLGKPLCLWYLLQSNTEELKPNSRKSEALFSLPAREVRIISQA